MSKNYEVPFKDAKLDKHGYTMLVVKVGEWYVPAMGKPESFTAYDRCHMLLACNTADIKRLNLTNWILKDIPEIAKLTGKLFNPYHAEALYWNGNEAAWNFYDEGLGGLDDESDEVIDKLNDFIDWHDGDLYKPHVDREGNCGDESVHCVYFGNSDVTCFSDCSDEIVESWDDIDGHEEVELPKVKLGHAEADCLEDLKDEAICMIQKARRNHKKIPYAEIGAAIREFISFKDDNEIGKIFMNRSNELYTD